MDFRHEGKHEISPGDVLALRARLSAVMAIDPHARDGRYTVSSLYFDTPDGRALREKINGVSRREKFRLRYYNSDTSLVLLEKKMKIDGLCSKLQTAVPREEAMALVRGEYQAFSRDGPPLLQELYGKMATQGLRPRTVVRYTREPFIYTPGNVRVTLDYNIRAGTDCGEFLDPDGCTIPLPNNAAVLEVKWDSFLPSVIRDLVQIPGVRTGAFSKYAACRVYG
ncbi:polyphosphate polymerase domain-containing protein [Acutalibacter muris]|uniref:polyphosphate polymerase domain-containing protein n=1 Tax=Acutalibacter muris TaxID=1796620 RepID=UPI0025B769B6|nr:polyphosphate polymerase domain-containing protein [Acutalibacter muris]MCI9193678.1 polyphosphate polymerase domain-containing protein [Acutalibacter muris]